MPRRILTDEEKVKIKQMRQEDFPVELIAERFGISIPAVYRVWK